MWTEALFEVRIIFGYFRVFYKEKSKLNQMVKKFPAFYEKPTTQKSSGRKSSPLDQDLARGNVQILVACKITSAGPTA
jgi:hypothetical protein